MSFEYNHYTTNEIKPLGWLKSQLRIQANGLSGNLDKIWPDIAQSAWIGGSREGWERVPYWLDGFIPLAYLLNDDDMIARAKKYIDAIIDGQRPDGWICPCSDEERGSYDLWAVFLICKVLVNYYECSSDPRIEAVVYKTLKQLKVHIQTFTLHQWSASRWFECLIPISWLYSRTGEEWLKSLAITLASQGTDYKLLYENFCDKVPEKIWCQQTHVVNAAMALKAYALLSDFTGNETDTDAENMLSVLNKYHGTCFGLFTGDECFSGTSPIQGTELCAVAEGMYSFEKLFEATGHLKWADRLEQLAYNALPAALSDDMWSHQYDQMVNQIACTDFAERHTFRTNNGEANIFGLEPNFGCCTANFNQAWPKLCLSAFYHNENSIVCALPAPAELKTTIHGVSVSVNVKTDYPFRDTAEYTVIAESPVLFDFKIRIPSFASGATVNGQYAAPGTMFSINRMWQGETLISLKLSMPIKLNKRERGLYYVSRGALIYSIPIKYNAVMHEYERDGVTRKFPYCDYELLPDSNWQYGLVSDKLEYSEYLIDDIPFSSKNPPCGITAKVSEIGWGEEAGFKNICAEKPNSLLPLSPQTSVVLRPYGCCKLRITEIPYIK